MNKIPIFITPSRCTTEVRRNVNEGALGVVCWAGSAFDDPPVELLFPHTSSFDAFITSLLELRLRMRAAETPEPEVVPPADLLECGCFEPCTCGQVASPLDSHRGRVAAVLNGLSAADNGEASVA